MNLKEDQYDDMLFELLKETRTIPNFFDAIFGFLNRRTDFYHIANDSNCVVGLPKGLSENIVRDSYFKWKPTPTSVVSSEEIPVISECVVETEEVIDDSCDQQLVNPQQKDCFTKSESYNGSVFEHYCWSQTVSEVDIVVKLPANVTRKDVLVDISPSFLKVIVKSSVIISGELCYKCKANDAIWSIEGEKLQIHLEKCQEVWWNCLVKGEKELQISKIDCSRPYEELSEEARAKIEELQWNQERKRLGLPTSEEIALQDTLKKAWNAKGSPFSGPFDPSVVSLN